MRFRGWLFAAVLVLGLAAPVAHAAPSRFDLGIHDPLDPAFGETDTAAAYDVVRATNVRFVRIPVPWGPIAPTQPRDPSAHEDPAYQWDHLDQRVRGIVSRGMEPILALFGAPAWARDRGPNGLRRLSPRPAEFAAFAAAAARRYSGDVATLPRVRHWQIWNEPNLWIYLDQEDSVAVYRELLTHGYAAIHGVSPANRVVAGGLAPFPAYAVDTPPLRFMRELLCIGREPRLQPTCDIRVPFDVWSHHPYTAGGPNRRARGYDGVSLGNLPQMARVLRAAERAGHVTPRGRRPFWVTEFSWDTRPPDPGGVPLALHARWVAEAFHRMWRSGVSMAVWFQLRDNERGALKWGQTWQSGLYFRTTARYADERAKPVLRVLRFPFVALPAPGGAQVWGRVPRSQRARVTIERRAGTRWIHVVDLRANPAGVFARRVRVSRGALLRARVGRAASVPFRVVPTRDRKVNTFG